MPQQTTPSQRNEQARYDEPLLIRAAIAPASAIDGSRTVECSFGSETPVPFWMNGERAHEVLSFTSEHIRLGFFNEGASLLDNHQRWGSVTDSVIGVVEKAWSDGTRGYARIRFATNEAGERCWKMVREGSLRWLSVGYRVFKYLEEFTETGPATYRAIDWEPLELSLVPVPADTSASVRSDKPGDANPQPVTHDVTIISHSNIRAMEEEVVPTTAPTAAPQPPTAQTAPIAAPAPPATPVVEDGQRGAAPAQTAGQTVAIMQAVRAAGLDLQFAESLISEGVTAEVARERCVTEWAIRGQSPPVNGNTRVIGVDPVDSTRADMEAALMHRINPTANPLPDGARAWAGLNMLETYRQLCSQRNISLQGLSRREIAENALGLRSMGGLHSTSDFPLLLGNTVNRTLRAAYELQERTWLAFSQRTTAQDFREMTAVQLGEASGFDQVLEGGEYKRGTVSEQSEKYKVVKYGKIYGFTWEMLINDDLSAFTRMPRLIAAQAVQKQNDVVWDLLLTGSGQIMADGVALFHASHNNLAATGTVLSVASLAAARAAMRKHKALDGTSYLNITPRYLVVGPDNELLAFQFTSTQYVPAKSSDVNVTFITSLIVIVDPRITDGRWYLIAAPGAIDTLEYAFLEGEGELFTETRYGFDVDGMEIKARMVFGAHALEFRSFYKNPGA